MKKLTDEEIDSLFKEAAEGYEPPYHPSDWEVMNKKLEGADFRMPQWAILSIIGSIVFMAGIGVGVWMDNQKTPVQPVAVQDTESDAKRNASTGNENTPDGTIQAATISKSTLSNASASTVKSSMKKTLPLTTTSSLLSTSLSTTKEKNANDPSFNDMTTSSSDSKSIAITSLQLPQGSNAPQSPSLTQPMVVGLSIDDPKTTDANPPALVNPSTAAKIDSSAVAITKENQADSLIEKAATSPSKKISTLGKWFIKVMASPDNSSINFSSTAFAGTNFSAQVEYQLSKRWSLSTGVILSNKKYQTDGDVMYGGKKAKGLDGSCRVLDIPIMAYYKISTIPRFAFYTGFGFSSYLMLSENYKYSVVYNSTSYPYNTQIEGRNNEWFKLINVSLGVNYRLNDHWSLLAEPFAKLPMAGVGEGKVLLSSTGLFLGIKYKIH
jgi:hypothetical protein